MTSHNARGIVISGARAWGSGKVDWKGIMRYNKIRKALGELAARRAAAETFVFTFRRFDWFGELWLILELQESLESAVDNGRFEEASELADCIVC